MILALNKFSDHAIYRYLHKVSQKYLKGFQSDGADFISNIQNFQRVHNSV